MINDYDEKPFDTKLLYVGGGGAIVGIPAAAVSFAVGTILPYTP
jgi:hypothetical protein